MESISVYWTGAVLVIVCVITIIILEIFGKKELPARESDIIAWGCKVTAIGSAAGLILLGIIYGIVHIFNLQFNICTVLAITLGIAFIVPFVIFGLCFSEVHSKIFH